MRSALGIPRLRDGRRRPDAGSIEAPPSFENSAHYFIPYSLFSRLSTRSYYLPQETFPWPFKTLFGTYCMPHIWDTAYTFSSFPNALEAH